MFSFKASLKIFCSRLIDLTFILILFCFLFFLQHFLNIILNLLWLRIFNIFLLLINAIIYIFRDIFYRLRDRFRFRLFLNLNFFLLINLSLLLIFLIQNIFSSGSLLLWIHTTKIYHYKVSKRSLGLKKVALFYNHSSYLLSLGFIFFLLKYFAFVQQHIHIKEK